MREILFKAKRKNLRELPKEEWWVYGDAIHEPIGMTIRYMNQGISVRIPVDLETLCQYTGMKDKNEKRIWENDLIVIGGKICLVKWSEKDVGWCFIRKLTDQEAFFGGPINPNDCKVIGNIFDDLELWGKNTYEY